MYKPHVLASNFKRGPSGVAVVELSGDATKVRVTFKDKGDKYIVLKSNSPEYVRKGTWFVTLSDDKSKILNFRPANGVFVAKVTKFPASEGQPPVPRTRTGPDYSYQFFVVILELLSPEVKGMEVPAILRYHFAQAEEDGKSVVAFNHPKSKYTPQLIEFCDVTGLWNRGPMPYKDNILPLIEKRVLHENKQFQVVMKNGYIDSFMESDVTVPEDVDNGEENFTPQAETLDEDD